MHFSLMNGWKREGIRKNRKNLKILEFSHFEGEKLNNPTCSLHLLKAMVCGEVPALVLPLKSFSKNFWSLPKSGRQILGRRTK